MSLSRPWEANIELMQANTKDRFLNMQIFSGLLGCVRKICIERFIEHVTVVDIEDTPQDWYRDFFRLAGFCRCRCRDSAGGTRQLQKRSCLVLRQSPDAEISAVYGMIRTWLAKGLYKRALLDSVASSEATEVKRRQSHDLLAEIENKKRPQSGQVPTKITASDRRCMEIPWQEPTGRSLAPKKKTFKRLKQHWSCQSVLVKSIGTFGVRVSKKRKRSKKLTKNALGLKVRHQTRKIGRHSCTRTSAPKHSKS